MAKPSKVGDYMGTFLDTVKSGPDSSPASSGSAAKSNAPNASIDLTARAVAMLVDVESKPAVELQTEMELGIREFGDLVSTMDRLGLIKISGLPGAEEIGLTEQGRTFSQLR